MKITRRHLLIGAAGAGLAAGAVAAQKIGWNRRNFTRAGYVETAPQAPPGEASWMNWSGIERATPRQIAFPGSVQALAETITGAKGRIRPVGSGHSFTGLATTEDTLLMLNGLSGLISYDAATGEARFGAGTPLFDVSEILARHGRALDNQPDIDSQTLAGAFATATHGTGNNLTALHNNITAFELVTADGRIREVTAASDPDLFEAGKVSLGALGVFSAYTIRTVPAYRLKRVVTVEDSKAFLSRLEETAEAHRNFEFYYFPHTGLVASIVHDLTDEPATEDDGTDDDDFLQGLMALRDQLGWAPWLRRSIARSEFPRGVVEDRVNESRVLLSTTRPTRFIEMEYHLPRERGAEMVERVMRKLDQRAEIFFPMEYRHIAPDTAWLSPFNAGPRTSIAIHALASERYDYFFTDFEPMYREAGGRPHWGKLHSLGHAELTALYPEFERFLSLRAELDPEGRFLNAHLAKLFGVDFDV
ncbi:MAG: FAD-binding protein [Hyphomonas sp.]|uniref:D-arabinono-1,4-lactone oxidase n=1 Tax=Hyphomonas sp. TaxID=87 RepID=UPI00185E6DE2|nr:D-arabinono-1,4-lactone oxidase [Hyphomonas sp.]MBU3921734.1 FAD-binding protein [Alphaproteobacteria bacterium]MBA3070111.1 FAD-binding protein [Hyphomonas sp.]MBU4060313.1 FAD-binding protein [Alphaproteobacteria bacterium]MBU4162981.1 FAD-binding protein [Alphaproteobacteria bacterium]MBU4568764.1 FAD-binding protein [Alphaproteobacteria bacterium]